MASDKNSGGNDPTRPGDPRDATSPVDPQDQYFDTAHLMANLSGRSARGGLVTVSAQGLKLVLQTGGTMVLARLLTPADFGLLAMVGFFTGIIGLFADFGLSAATIQRAKVRHAQVSTLFWVNVALSIVLMLVTAAVAPLIAWFYGESELVLITLALSATFLFGGISAQHIAILRRQMRFTGLAGVEIGALFFGIATAIVVALLGGGYWALVCLTAGQALATAVLAFLLSGWRPGWWHFDGEVWQMIRFGGNLTGASFLGHITRNVDNMLLGKFWGASELGIYSRAYALLLLPLKQINGPISSVAMPALSRLQSEPEAFRRYYLKLTQTISYISMPLVVLLAVLADEVVLVILGPQWAEAVIVFQIFAVFVFFQNAVATSGWVMQSLGEGRRMLRWGMIQAPIIVAACLIGLPWGARGVAVAATVQALVIMVPAMAYAFKNAPFSASDAVRAMVRPALVSLPLLIFAYGAKWWTIDAVLVVRVGAVLCSAIISLALVVVLSATVRSDIANIRRVLRK